MKKFFTIIALLGISSLTFAQRLITEDFNYAVGQLTAAGAGANVSMGNWINHSATANYIQVVSGSLMYANYVTSPSGTSNKVALNAVLASAEDAHILFTPQTSGTVYASFLLNVRDLTNLADNTLAGDFFTGFLASTSLTYSVGRVYIKKGVAANTFNLGISAQTPLSTPIAYSVTDYSITTTHIVTVAYNFVVGANNDNAKLFVDAPYSATEPVPAATSPFIAGTEPVDAGRFFLRQNFGGSIATPNADIDAIKVSTTYADATLTNPLPLTLATLKVYLADKNVQLNWTSDNEQNLRSYTIERSSDGRNFSAINVVDAKNTIRASYLYSDNTPLAAAGYYRLKITDRDGAIKYSNIVYINNRKGIKAQVFPNPVSDNLNVSYTKAVTGASIRIYNASGQQVKTFTIPEGTTQTSLLVNDLVKGNYTLSYLNNGESTNSVFIKN